VGGLVGFFFEGKNSTFFFEGWELSIPVIDIDHPNTTHSSNKTKGPIVIIAISDKA
jgi:hypothetical protein